MKKRIFCMLTGFLLLFILAISAIPSNHVKAASNYNANAALDYARSHWNDGQGQCAEFVSRCVKAGGINMPVITTTYECYKKISELTGVAGQDLTLNSSGYATYSANSSKLSAGDVVIQWCYSCNLRPHILLCGGYNSSGNATFYAHNAALNNGVYKLNQNSLHTKSSCNVGAKVIHISAPSDTTAPAISDVRVTDVNAGGYTVVCRVEDAGGIARVQFPTWTHSNGQDDLVPDWGTNLRCRGEQNGTIWSYRVNVGDHNNEEGWYCTHIYAYDTAGNFSSAGIDAYVDRTPPVISEVQVTDINSEGYTVICKAEDASSAIARVQFPTWTTANDQDDLAANWWDNPSCRGTQNGTIWTFRVNVSEHNFEEGIYRTHIYAYDAAGNSTPIAVNDIYIDRTAPVISNVQVTDIDSKGYTVTCTVEDVSSGVNKVQFPTWTTANGQDDLAVNWWDNPSIKGVQNGTTWSFRVNIADHNNESGFYRTHIYAYDEAGNRSRATEVADMYIKNTESNDTNKHPGNMEQPGTTENNTSGVEDAEVDSDDFTDLEPIEEDDHRNETVITIKKIFGRYKIISMSETNSEVAFIGTIKKNAKKITIPDTITYQGVIYSVTEISENALKNCKKLQYVNVGSNIVKIGKNAFKGCKKLKSITIKSKKINSVGKNAFKNISKKCRIKVLKSKMKDYKELILGK